MLYYLKLLFFAVLLSVAVILFAVSLAIRAIGLLLLIPFEYAQGRNRYTGFSKEARKRTFLEWFKVTLIGGMDEDIFWSSVKDYFEVER